MKQIIKILLLFLASLFLIASPSYSHEINKEKIEIIIKNFLTQNPSFIQSTLDDYKKNVENTKKQNAITLLDSINNPGIFEQNADITIYEFFDYNCGYCKRSFPEIMELVSENKDIKIILKELPVLGESSILASKASIASQKQDKYFEFHQELINFSGIISLIDIKKISKELGINYEQLQKDMNSEETILLINESYRLADLIGVRGTPAFIINNNLIPGAIGKNEMLRFLNK